MKLIRKAALALAGMGATIAIQGLRARDKIDFSGKSVLITGGSRGLGLVIARQLAAEGARLTLVARNAEELQLAAQDLSSRRAEVQAFPCDVRNQQEVQRAIERVVDHYGHIDVVINNAGVIQVGPIDHMQLSDFEDALAVHVWGPLYTTLAALPHMRRQGGGRIVNIASIGGKIAVPHLVPYSASKFALVGLSNGMHAELAKDGIRVTTVCPGLMRTGSHFNALFKGHHENEFTWFALFDALPISSVSAEYAARQIINACRYGDPHLTISIQAKAIATINTLLPGLTAKGMELLNLLLPKPADGQGNEIKTGWESQSSLAPSILTQLADQAALDNNEVPPQQKI